MMNECQQFMYRIFYLQLFVNYLFQPNMKIMPFAALEKYILLVFIVECTCFLLPLLNCREIGKVLHFFFFACLNVSSPVKRNFGLFIFTCCPFRLHPSCIVV
uniref:Uncharacterized protein n=1 Tax=Arundo donax TaxID=35708 RepID=A0A0A9G153_ARUDO